MLDLLVQLVQAFNFPVKVRVVRCRHEQIFHELDILVRELLDEILHAHDRILVEERI